MDMKAQLERLWERGELQRDLVTSKTRFTFRLTLKSPGSADITDRFDSVRSWAAELATAAPLRIEWLEVRYRIQDNPLQRPARQPNPRWSTSGAGTGGVLLGE